MHEISILKVDITLGDGKKQELLVDAEIALIGSGAHCEVRLPAEDAAHEQLEVHVSAAGIWARARSLDRSILVDGAPFVDGLLTKDAVLQIGGVRLRLLTSTTNVFEKRASKGEQAGNRAIHALALIGFPLGFALLLGMSPPESELPDMVEPPPLFEATAEPCKSTEPEAAHAFAERELARGEAERERAPFHGGSGVLAVRSFERAAGCLRAAHEDVRAAQTRSLAAKLRGDVEKEFHVHHVRLGRALETAHYDVARREIALLIRYLGKRGSEYREWLLALDRNLELKFSGQKQ